MSDAPQYSPGVLKYVEESKKFLSQMAEEERTHLKELGNLMDTIIGGRSIQ